MSDKFFNNEESGIPVPPADKGWMAMQQMLDKAMPVQAPSTPAKPKPGASSVIKTLLKGALISGTAATIGATAFWTFQQYGRTTNTPPAIVKPVTSPATDSISAHVDSSLTAIGAVLEENSSHQVNADLNIQEQPTDKTASDHSYTNANKPVVASTHGSITPPHPASVSPRETNGPENNSGTAKGTPATLLRPAGSANKAVAGDAKEHTKITAGSAANKTASNPAVTANTDKGTTRQPSAADRSKDTRQQAGRSKGSKGYAAIMGIAPALPDAGQQASTDPSQVAPLSADAPEDIARPSGIPQNTPVLSGAGQPAIAPQLPVQGALPAARGVADLTWVLEPIPLTDQRGSNRLLHNDRAGSSFRAKNAIKKTREQPGSYRIYAQLNIAAPIRTGSYYLSAPNGNDQYVRSLIPIIRIERKLYKSALSLDLMPLTATATNDSLRHYTNIGTGSPMLDTAWSVQKRFGYGAAFQYQHFLTEHFAVSGGLQLSVFNQALIKQTISDSMWVYGPAKLRAADKRELEELATTRLNGVIELYYILGKWQAGVKTILPLNINPGNGWNPKTPVRVELLIRRRLISFK
ncbi:hypothetical protein [Chitinophaga agri]|uniref:Uncharacterized protein n=1 Tax=Chitinophaga agri TaxID=2703787 RepID=A0A6B9ZAE6_9BACT|nr:hypothetical protein [Chitinophaga agri]QHS58461.1 hypothetical protein GWR21_02280 [Chitinophaga agri]